MVSERAVRVLVADDHWLVRAGLERLIHGAAGLDAVGFACDGREAVSMAAELEPDVVVMDVSMPGIDGIEATREIVETQPGTTVLVLSLAAERSSDALAAGASGFVRKDVDPEVILSAIRTVANGGAGPFPPLEAA
jgi:DNA-binding NarL/FixJ family response regulator